MTSDEFREWLDSVRVSAPFTVDDAHELKSLIKDQLPNAVVDVFTHHGDKVFVIVRNSKIVIQRTIDVVRAV